MSEDDDSISLACKHVVCERIKMVIVSGVVMALILVIFVGISLGYCVLKLPPIANFILMFLALTLLAFVEALHYAVVAVEKWDMHQYQERFPRAVKCHALVNTPEKVKKFLVGRQFFVIFVVFLLAQITSFPSMPKNFLGMPPIFVLILVKTGLPGVALTLTFGQLVSQIFVEEFTLQFLNLIGCEFCIRLSLAAEYIGVCNFSWLLYGVMGRIFCGNIRRIQKTMKSTDNMLESQQEECPVSPTQLNRGPNFDTGLHSKTPLTWFDYLKYAWSTFATLGSVFIVCVGIFKQSYVLPVGPVGAYIIALLDLTLLFFLEGLMIAIVGTQYWDPETFREAYPRAYRVHKLVNRPNNVKRFIIGRQFCTVLTGFLLAQIFTFANWKSTGYNPILFYIVIKSGLVGVLVVLAFGQLMPELLAVEYPLRFMNMFGSYSVVYISLVFDKIGVGHAAWSFYYTTRALLCKSHMQQEGDSEAHHEGGDSVRTVQATKPKIVRVNSAEILAFTTAAAASAAAAAHAERTESAKRQST